MRTAYLAKKLTFARAGPTKPGGTGLGLHIVQEIVTAHAGRLSVESVAGQGTTFTITLACEAEGTSAV
jgi:signal transduction histidine kinase